MKKGTTHQDQLTRLKRIEGQVRGLSKMIEEQRYCIDIITQIKAVRSALGAVESRIIDDHLDHCVQQAITTQDRTEAETMLREIKDLLKSTRRL